MPFIATKEYHSSNGQAAEGDKKLNENKQKDIVILYLEWGSKNREVNFKEIQKILNISKTRFHIIVVDNKMECKPISFMGANSSICIPGNNISREFSGWDVGLKYLESMGIFSNLVLFVNDTFATHRRPRLFRRLRIAHFINYASHEDKPVLFGQLDPARYSNMKHPLGNMNNFICTYFFGMNTSAIGLCSPLCDIESDIENVLETDPSSSEVLKNSVDITYRKHINEWYHQGNFWMNSESLNPQNFNFFRLKIKSVLYEHALALKCRERGVKVINIYSGSSKGDAIIGGIFLKWLNFTAYCTRCIREMKLRIKRQ
ncbi:hypothetical protein ACFZ8E_14525 [Methylobacterium sp. HMF5984]|uniref:hypothetical protein n=1 Tax=Methylobacterium sp. HMF5984 TaxID=3367370 RepID=UPI0038553353